MNETLTAKEGRPTNAIVSRYELGCYVVMLEKLRQFHRDHHSPMEQLCEELHEAFNWLPKSAFASESRPLVDAARKRRRRPTSIGELLVRLPIRPGVGLEDHPVVALNPGAFSKMQFRQ